MRILVTGASGFVGQALCRHLTAGGHSVLAAVRTATPQEAAGTVVIGDLAAKPSWDRVLVGVDVVIHLAALVHQMGRAAPPFEAYRALNATATENLAASCVRHGVRRFVFLSSVKVNGERSPFQPFTETDEPTPEDNYGRSRLEAGQSLLRFSSACALETVIVRPPLVYGPGVRANFRRLLKIAARMNPLIVPATANKRSLIGLENLVDFLSLAAVHPAAANQTFLVSDCEDVSVSELLHRLAKFMGHRTFRVPAAEGLLRRAARLFGKGEEARRILDPLTVSPEKALKLLSWLPPVSLDAGLQSTAEWYLTSRKPS